MRKKKVYIYRTSRTKCLDISLHPEIRFKPESNTKTSAKVFMKQAQEINNTVFEVELDYDPSTLQLN